jgi:hypothetical protein
MENDNRELGPGGEQALFFKTMFSPRTSSLQCQVFSTRGNNFLLRVRGSSSLDIYTVKPEIGSALSSRLKS